MFRDNVYGNYPDPHKRMDELEDHIDSQRNTTDSLQRKTKWVDIVTDFGADPTGLTNSTTAIKTAFQYAKNNGIKRVVAPEGTFLVDASKSSNFTSFTIFNGITFEGSGYNTVFKVNPSSINSNGYWKLFYFESNVVLNNFRVDGQKDKINRTGLTSLDFIPIYPSTEYTTGYIADMLWIHDVIGVNLESFGITTRSGDSNVKFRNIRGWNVEGTPVHVSGDYLNNKLVKDVEVSNCDVYYNTWQGISVYGGEDVVLRNIKSYGNATNGLNFEWCKEVRVHDSAAYDNGAGIGTFGKANVKVYDSQIYNNAKSVQNAEIAINVGSWYTGNLKGNAGVVEFHNCRVTPSTVDKYHLHIDSDDTVTEGISIPDKVVVNSFDGKDWRIKVKDFDGTSKSNVILPCVHFNSLPTIKPVVTGKLWDWDAGGGVSSVNYTGTDKLNPDAVTYSSSAQYQNRRTKYVMKPNSLYLVSFRVKPSDTGAWSLFANDHQNTQGALKTVSFGGSKLANNWITGHMLVKTPSFYQWRLQMQCNSAVASSIVVDYITVTEITSTGQSDMTLEGTWDREHLVLGTYRIWVDSTGKLRIKNGAPTSDTDGTVIGTQT